ncbi:MAG: CoA transferase [Chloroflexi bacterium]|nr:CoA transferase [Chloroflexota bacterium]
MDNRSPIEFFLSPARVLDLTDEKGYYFCTKILGDLGADVIRIEKPGVKRDFWWWAYNYKKKLVYLDIEKGPEQLLQLVREADFLVESFPPGYLDSLGLGYTSLKKVNPKLIMTSITPFGQTGPHRDLKASDLELMATSGVLVGIGDPDRPPVRISFPQAHLITSAEAAVGTLIALCHREVTDEGQKVDVSAQESVHAIGTGTGKRMGRFAGIPAHVRPKGAEVKYQHPRTALLWECKDGHVAYWWHPGVRGAHNNRALVKYMEMEGDLPDIVRNIQWETIDPEQTSPADMAQIWDAFARLFARHTHQEIYQIALKERIELLPGNTVKDLLTEEQLQARGFWQEQDVPDLSRTLRFPGPFARVHFPPASDETGTAPREKQGQGLPFQGLKVLDFSWVYTGPFITQWLAIYGAEVIKVESSSHLDVGRRRGGLGGAAWNSAKKSIALNLKHPRGSELCRRLVKWADVMVENFTPGTMQRLGFGYEDLLKINPQIIMFSASTFGANGPHAAQPGLGMELASLAGFNDLTGWPDRLPVSAHGPYTDILACRIGGATLFAALYYRRRTGKGCSIDLSQFEASMHFLAPLILEHQATGRFLPRMGNRSLTDSPHGVFPCQGDDRWCAISVSSDSEWQTFCEALGRPEWVKDLRFATFEARKQNEDELEKLIAMWTAPLPAREVMARLQKAGVKAGIVADQSDLLKDPQLEYRKHFISVTHPQAGQYVFSNSGFRLEKAAPVVNSAPLFGEHSKYVATQILGLSDVEFDDCLSSGVFE